MEKKAENNARREVSLEDVARGRVRPTQAQPGTFSWVTLNTTNTDAAKKFYGDLFGWTYEDRPGGSTAKIGDKPVCALFAMSKEMMDQKTLPHWLSWVTVDDVDALTTKATPNGGKVVQEPVDLMDDERSYARMSVVSDPTGATLVLWQPRNTFAAHSHDPSAPTWNELFTKSVDHAGEFYVNVIGWKALALDMGPMGTYTLFSRDGTAEMHARGGMMNMPQTMKGVPPCWLMYFATPDCDASAKKVTDLGGKVLSPPMDVPNVRRFAICQDPQGATFAMTSSIEKK